MMSFLQLQYTLNASNWLPRYNWNIVESGVKQAKHQQFIIHPEYIWQYAYNYYCLNDSNKLWWK